jgi:hypothetical protein
MNDERIVPSFYLSEFLHSDTAVRRGLDNTPDALSLANIRNFLAPGMQSVRELLGRPVVISSGFRSPAVNRAVGGSRTSQHMVGLAADFICPGFGTPLQVARALVASSIKFDQLIQEGTWVHVSFNAHPRRSVLTAVFTPNGTTYRDGLV